MNNGISQQESRAISFARVCAMFMIILCHYFNCFSITAPMAQVFNVGVEVFFIISGFLYGRKNVNKPFIWFVNRMKKILIPLYIYYAVMLVILYITNNFGQMSSISKIALITLNLQGIFGGSYTDTLVTGHLWFVSFIMVCYIITPLLVKLKESVRMKKVVIFLIVSACISSVLMTLYFDMLPTRFWVRITGIYCYIVAFFISNRPAYKKRRSYLILTLVMITFLVFRLAFNFKIINGNVYLQRIYDVVVANYTYAVLGFWVFYTLLEIGKVVTKKEVACKLIKKIDKLSYYVYIIHYMFLTGVFSIISITTNKIMNLIIFIIVTMIISILLKMLSEGILKLLNRGEQKND